MTKGEARDRVTHWPTGDGEMAAQIRAFDWSATPLGPIARWPQSLRTVVDLALGSPVATVLLWGPTLVQVYNDHWRLLMSRKHPAALGRPTHESFPEIADVMAPFYERALRGDAAVLQDRLLPLLRDGVVEDAWWNVHYLPVRDEGGTVAGILCTVIETTAGVLAERERAAAADASRSSEERYQALFAASPVPFMVLAPDPPDFTITAANDAYLAATLTTREGLIGRRLFDVFTDDPSRPGDHGSEALDVSLGRVMASRRPDAMPRTRYDIVTPGGGFEPHWWLAINAPMLDATGRITAIIHQVTRVTELHFAELAEQEHRARQAYLLKLNDALRPLVGAEAVKRAAARILGEHLDVNRAFYGEVEGDDWLIPGDYERGIVPLTPGRYAADTYGNWMMDTFRAGDVLDFSDSRSDPRFGAPEREALARFQITAALGIGLVKGGRLVAFMAVHSGTPRRWAATEVSLLAETAERTWAAIERARAEAALRESEGLFSQFAASSSDALWIRDTDTLEMEYISPACEAVYGVPPAALLDGAWHWTALIVREDRDRALADLERVKGGEAVVQEFRIMHARHGMRWIRNTVFPLFDAKGDVQRIGGIAQDLTEVKRASERQDVMVAELQHRTRNLIAVVKGIADETMRETGPNPAFRAAFGDRLSALSRVQGLLARSEAEPVTVGSLIRLELDAFGAGKLGDRVVVTGPEVFLRPSTVQTLALALHELSTNARKYGALSHDAGRLAVTWRKRSEAGEARLAIEWVESGLDQAPERLAADRADGGYGRELIEQALPHALGARTSYALSASGVSCTIDLAVRAGKDER